MRIISIWEEGMTYTKIHDKLKQKEDKGKLERVERNRKYKNGQKEMNKLAISPCLSTITLSVN